MTSAKNLLTPIVKVVDKPVHFHQLWTVIQFIMISSTHSMLLWHNSDDIWANVMRHFFIQIVGKMDVQIGSTPPPPPRLHLSAFSWPPSPLECGRHIWKALTSINHIQGVRGVEFLQWLRARVSLLWVGKETVCRPHFTICDCWTKPPSTCQSDDLSGDHIQSRAEKRDWFAKHQLGMAGCGWLQPGRNFLST